MSGLVCSLLLQVLLYLASDVIRGTSPAELEAMS
jgi:hypothetical protein